MSKLSKPGWHVSPRAVFVLLGAAVVTPGWSQALEGVVVSASRAEQRSFDAPASIQSVERDVIQDGGPQVNLSESLNRVPGLTILNRQNYAQDLQVSIRGFGARTAFGIRGVRLLIDGIPATTPDGQGQGSSISLPSTERIEVLRGPLAQLYGNSAGGVIQAFTREAPEVPELIYQYYGGSFGMHRNDLQYAGKSGKVGIVADYSTFDTNGYRDNSTTQRKQFNGKLSFGPDEKTRVNLVFNQFDMPLAQDPIGLTALKLAENPQQTLASTNYRVRKIVLQNQLGSSLTHELGADRSISARLYYGTRDNTQFQSGNTWIGLNRAYYGMGLQYNQQIRLGQMPVRWAAGYEFDRSREFRQSGDANGAGEKSTTTRSEDNQAESSDLFAQATALVSERYSITGGVRYSSVRMFSDDYFGNGAGSGNVSYSAASPVLGVTWHASDSLNIYANYGRGFETPTLSEVAYTGATGTPQAAFKTSLNASTSQHYEIGAKWVPSPQTRLDLTAFQITTSDEIVVENSTGGKTTYKNSGGTSRTGLEMALRSHLNRRLMATLSASAIDVTYTQGFCTTASCTANTVLAGNKLPGIPQHFLFGELLWTGQPLEAGQRKPRLGAKAGIEMISAGRLYANDANSASADGYTTFNLKASHGWAVGKGSLTAYARADNVTDQRYVGSVIVNQSSQQYYEPAPGYNWTLGLRLSLPL